MKLDMVDDRDLENIIRRDITRIKEDIPKTIEKIYSNASEEILLNEYTGKILRENYGRINELDDTSRLMYAYANEPFSQHIEHMFYCTKKAIQTIQKVKINVNKKVSVKDDMINKYEKEKSGILQEWVTFEYKTHKELEGTPDCCGYIMKINSTGQKILDGFEEYMIICQG